MTDWGKPCTEHEQCTYHNLHCGYPNCVHGRWENAIANFQLAAKEPNKPLLKKETIEALIAFRERLNKEALENADKQDQEFGLGCGDMLRRMVADDQIFVVKLKEMLK